MSSFRIDRQYVTFVAAETKAFYPTGQKSRRKGGASPDEAQGMTEEELAHNEAELEWQMRQRAEEEAALLRKEAEEAAQAILEEAKDTARQMVEQAQAQGEELRRQAQDQGYREGTRQAEEAARAQKEQEAAQLLRLTEQLKENYAELVNQAKDDIVALVIDIVKKVIGIRLQESDEIFMDLIRTGIETVKHNGAVSIHLSPQDYHRYFGEEAGEQLLQTEKAEITVCEEETYAPGDLVLESEYEVLDFSIDKQIDRLEAGLLQEGS